MSKLIIANWKSNKTYKEAYAWLTDYQKEILPWLANQSNPNQAVICPPFPFLPLVSDWAGESSIAKQVSVGTQDISAYPAGSYTGGVSGVNLEHFNVKYSIVGHSERRKYFHETLQDIARKVDLCLQEGITPIVCVDRQEIQFQADLIEPAHYRKIIVAYEPVEYIGVGVAQEASEVLSIIKEIKNAFSGVRTIYGGSVNPDNIDQFNTHSEIEGYLVGSASLDAENFADLVKRG